MTIIKHEPWECPRCKVINAPWVAHCTCRPEVKSKELESTINALIKISSDSSDLNVASNSNAHMYIVTPFKNKRKSSSSIFSTHPGIEERIEALKNLS